MTFDKQRHIKYFQRCHNSFLPSPYTAADSSRLTFASFIVAALDLLSSPLTPTDRTSIRRWVLSLQHPDGGFCGSSTHAFAGQRARKGEANVAATFFALILLAAAAVDDDEAKGAFQGVNRRKCLRWLRRLQRSDGSFGQNIWDGEPVGGRDMRHSYLASGVRWMLRGDVRRGDAGWEEDIDVEGMIRHIRGSQTYDGGFAEASEHESHGGYAFCGLAALALLERSPSPHPTAIQDGVADREHLLSFLAHRQFPYLAAEEDKEEETAEHEPENYIEAKLGEMTLQSEDSYVGFNGRWNKKADTCYTWWVVGSLAFLDGVPFISTGPSRRYIIDINQHRIGGFSKAAGAPPDVHHSFLSLAALATMGDDDLKEFDPQLCVSREMARKVEVARDGLLEREGKGEWWGDGFWDSFKA